MKLSHTSLHVVVLDNIRSALNVGALFRTAEAAGISHVYLCGYTPTPIDRFLREQSQVAKAALGAHTMVPWSHEESITKCLTKLRKKGFTIIAFEQTPESVDYRTLETNGSSACIFGNEILGVSKEALGLSDIVAHIPLYGKKESLNVTTAAGIGLFRLLHP
jgi:23S rRNA (guanosine2251-2'-O)-methyltransferase